jgi:hypothetical protein
MMIDDLYQSYMPSTLGMPSTQMLLLFTALHQAVPQSLTQGVPLVPVRARAVVSAGDAPERLVPDITHDH